jgi:hypothetical protein
MQSGASLRSDQSGMITAGGGGMITAVSGPHFVGINTPGQGEPRHTSPKKHIDLRESGR